MDRKFMAVILLWLLSALALSACGAPPSIPDPTVAPQPTAQGAVMPLAEAVVIAQRSACTTAGPLTDNATYNPNAQTWWIDIDADKPGCAPACMVSAVDKTAEINWRCTGLLPTRAEDDREKSPSSQVPDPAQARDAVLAYLRSHYADDAPAEGLSWIEATDPSAAPRTGGDQELVGTSQVQYTAGDWRVTVSFPLVNPTATIYQVSMQHQATGFLWEGEVDTTGYVRELTSPAGAQPVVGWSGFVEGLPEGAQFDDYFELPIDSEITQGLGMTGANAEVETQIQALRDSDTFIHVWGTLHCPAIDYNGCQLVVTRLRADRPGPLFDPDPVEGWRGTLIGLAPGAQHDAAFVLSGSIPVRYGVGSTNPEITAQLQRLRNTGTVVRLWGTLTCGVPGVNGTTIEVTRVEVQE